MARYINLNSNILPHLDEGNTQTLFSKITSLGGALNTNTIIIIAVVLLLVGIAVFYYFYYAAPNSGAKYHPNNEHMPLDPDSTTGTAELLFFYADWCPHCKAAKPIWNDLQAEYENKTINGYKIVFTEVDCSEETPEVEKLMNQYSVEGYPTIKLVKDGKVIEYDAKPSKETLTRFLNTVL